MAVPTTLKVIREAVAGQLGLLIDTTIDAVPDSLHATINALADKSPDAERMRDSYLYQSGAFRRIVSFGYPTTEDVTTARTHPFVTGAAQVYFMLDPDDLNAAINEALQEYYYIETETIVPVTGTYIYALPTWVQQKGQIIGLKWRDISVLTTRPEENEVGSYRILEDANVLSVYINEQLRSVTTYDLQLRGRRNFSKLANDSATTTCPYKLIYGGAMVSVLHKIFNKFGKGVASLYGQKMMVAEKELMTLKNDWLPKLVAREFIEEEYWFGPDKNTVFDNPTW